MKRIQLIIICVLCVLMCVGSDASGADVTTEAKRDKRKRATSSTPQDNPELPNVLLIGDSISIGYTAEVQKQLAGKADVFRIPGNGKYSEYGLQNLNKWIGSRKWDVIHFNWGLWDLCYRNPKSKTQGNRDKENGTLTATPEQYRANMKKIVARLKETNATLIWCTTTPVPEFEAGRKLGDDIKYNQIAEEIMKANGILINDLHSHALLKLPEIQVRKGDVHYTEPGYAYLAEKVVDEISSAISK
ncbi:SGNH/GDSL hydrolase family protein [Planctomycetes bacterium TBK1r]